MLLFHLANLLTQVWLLLFITIIAVVFSMSLFSKISFNYTLKNNSHGGLKFSKQSTTLTNYASNYLVYVLNIITNQGKNKIHILQLS